ncbi:hypothetical protein SK128_026666 [Halocaridina rubra]|uniref:Chitin-binding type-2 domain-containing protein n=1 Tax=Halocaridina rubra TaxID=373956 RepID=A0AAN8XL81_HALRR
MVASATLRRQVEAFGDRIPQVPNQSYLPPIATNSNEENQIDSASLRNIDIPADEAATSVNIDILNGNQLNGGAADTRRGARRDDIGSDGFGKDPRDGDSDGIPGFAGDDYPTLARIPDTGFNCRNQELPGYYADQDAQCQVFYICQLGGRQDGFLCPNGTLFSQQLLVCDWWYNVDCSQTSSFFSINEGIYAGAGSFRDEQESVSGLRINDDSLDEEASASNIQTVLANGYGGNINVDIGNSDIINANINGEHDEGSDDLNDTGVPGDLGNIPIADSFEITGNTYTGQFQDERSDQIGSEYAASSVTTADQAGTASEIFPQSSQYGESVPSGNYNSVENSPSFPLEVDASKPNSRTTPNPSNGINIGYGTPLVSRPTITVPSNNVIVKADDMPESQSFQNNAGSAYEYGTPKEPFSLIIGIKTNLDNITANGSTAHTEMEETINPSLGYLLPDPVSASDTLPTITNSVNEPSLRQNQYPNGQQNGFAYPSPRERFNLLTASGNNISDPTLKVTLMPLSLPDPGNSLVSGISRADVKDIINRNDTDTRETYVPPLTEPPSPQTIFLPSIDKTSVINPDGINNRGGFTGEGYTYPVPNNPLLLPGETIAEPHIARTYLPPPP